MADPDDTLDLLDYRRNVGGLYADVRASQPGPASWERWRQGRDELFAHHLQSPMEPPVRETFTGVPFFEYDPSWRVTAEVLVADRREHAIGHSGEGTTRAHRFGQVEFEARGGVIRLSLYWLDAYGGGAFLPFKDGTSGVETYGGGRYLLDTVKGADLGHQGSRMVLDFNYSYHPSCVHSDRWSCPLAPSENRVAVAIRAGERL